MNKQILRLAIPNIITTITVPLLGMVDVAIVGHLNSEYYIGAIAIGTMIFNLIYWNFGFLRMGTTGFTAQAYGAVDKEEISHILGRSLFIALSISIVLIALQYPIKTLAFKLIQASESVEKQAIEYFNIVIWGAPAILCLYATKGWFIGMQNAKLPMWIAIQINVVNIVLSFIFVFTLGMKIKGVALGSVLAQYIGLLTTIILWLIHYRKYLQYISIKKIVAWDKMIHFFRLNTDIFLRSLCLIAVFSFIPAEGAKLGDTTLAVNTLLMQFFTLFSYIVDGFAYAGESLIGRYIGSNNQSLVRKAIRYLFIWGSILTVLFTVMYAIFGKHILSIFTNNLHIIQEAQTYYFWVLIVPITGFSAFIWDGILVGATAGKIMRNAIFIATAVFFATYYVLSNTMHNNALWLAFVFFLLLRGVLQGIFSRKLFYQ